MMKNQLMIDIFLFWCTCDVLFVEGSDVTDRCIEPDLDSLIRHLPDTFVGATDLHSSFFNMHELTTYIRRTNGYINGTAKFNYLINGEKSCHMVQQSEIGQRGNMCPSYFILEHDPGRIPQDIIHAECTCRSCLFVDELSSPRREHFECQKIYSHTKVLRRTGCHNGVFSYRYAWEKVSVGCACALV